VQTWNPGAERITGYAAGEILGEHFSRFFPEEDRVAGLPEAELAQALEAGGRHREEWRVRRDGTRFWAEVTLSPLRTAQGTLRGFAKVTRDLTERHRAEEAIRRLAAELEQRVAQRTQELEAANEELEAFSYSVSHDLRTPLRAIDGFSKVLLSRYAQSLDSQGQHYLERVRAGTQRMGQLIDDLLHLSRLSRADLQPGPVDLAELARQVLEQLREREPERRVDVALPERLPALGDARLLRVVLENLLQNAWKFTSKQPDAQISVGAQEQDGQTVYFVRDNGAGFDMAYAGKLFGPFQRLHDSSEFEGTGIGLATVQRIVHRHGGRAWARSAPGQGTTLFFTLRPET
jgi:PAS domain S-box-containing protein